MFLIFSLHHRKAWRVLGWNFHWNRWIFQATAKLGKVLCFFFTDTTVSDECLVWFTLICENLYVQTHPTCPTAGQLSWLSAGKRGRTKGSNKVCSMGQSLSRPPRGRAVVAKASAVSFQRENTNSVVWIRLVGILGFPPLCLQYS